MEPQLVPIDPDMNSDMRKIRLAKPWKAVTGDSRNVLYLAMLIAAKNTVKKRAILGNAWIQYCT